MFIVRLKDGTIIRPLFSGQRTNCPGCGGELVACCGDIIPNHWRHLSCKDCDPWAETPGPWHIAWQKYLEEDLGAKCEEYIHKNGEYHRADAVLPNGTVVELQSSGISPKEIKEREFFYERMIWVFDAQSAYDTSRFSIRYKKGYETFRWKHPRITVAYTTQPTRLDLGWVE